MATTKNNIAFRKFDIIKHDPSERLQIVKYCIDVNGCNCVKVFKINDPVGGVCGCSFCSLIAKRFTIKWFIYVIKLLIEMNIKVNKPKGK